MTRSLGTSGEASYVNQNSTVPITLDLFEAPDHRVYISFSWSTFIYSTNLLLLCSIIFEIYVAVFFSDIDIPFMKYMFNDIYTMLNKNVP